MSITGGEEHRDRWIITPRLAKPSSAGHPTASTSSRHLPLRYATIYAYASILCPLACDLSLPCSRSTGISYIQCPCAMLSPFRPSQHTAHKSVGHLASYAVTLTRSISSRYTFLASRPSVSSAVLEYGVHFGSSWNSRMAVMVLAESTVNRW